MKKITYLLIIIFLISSIYSLNKYKISISYADNTLPENSTISIIGNFNNWNPESDSLKFNEKTKKYETTLYLPVGKYRYKFNINNKKWIEDPDNPVRMNSVYQGYDSILTVDNSNKNLIKCNPNDEYVFDKNIKHTHQKPYLFKDHNNNVGLVLRVNKDDLKKVNIVITENIKKYPTNKYEMTKFRSDKLYDYYIFKYFPVNNFFYSFNLISGNKKTYFGYLGLTNKYLLTDAFYYKTNSAVSYHIPDWFNQSVCYSILIDRYNNGNTENDPKPKFMLDWNDKPNFLSSYGGDIKGITEKLDYIEEFGFNCIKLSPCFKSSSYHKYITNTFLELDPEIGTYEDFDIFFKECNNRGIKVIMEVDFTYTGKKFFAFQDILNKRRSSKYLDWYLIDKMALKEADILNYEKWYGLDQSPKLNLLNPVVQNYIANSLLHWQKMYNIAGWYFNSLNQIPKNYLRQLYKKLKNSNQNILVSGEYWTDNTPYVINNEIDNTSNYILREIIEQYFIKNDISLKTFYKNLSFMFEMDQYDIINPFLNMLSSKDTPRIYSLIKNKDDLRPILILLYTLPGIPTTFYGDEIGLAGMKDPDNRKSFPWNKTKWNMNQYEFQKKLIKIRKNLDLLQKGMTRLNSIVEHKNIISYWRIIQDRHLLVLINNSDKNYKISLKEYTDIFNNYTQARDMLSNKKYNIENGIIKDILLPAKNGVILLPN